MNQKAIRRLIIMAVIALTGLMTVQIVWFKQAYDLRQRQFAEKANLALRFTANQLVSPDAHRTGALPLINQTANNNFRIQINDCFKHDSLPKMLERAFKEFGTASDYDVSVVDCNEKGVLLDYNYKMMEQSKEKPLVNQTQIEPCYYLNVTLKPATLMQEMWFWFLSALCCLLVLVYFAYSMYVMMKEKRLAEMKKDFINNMTHELKTPIANIGVASEMLKNAPSMIPSEKIKTYADIIYKENERLKAQVERVLQMAFIEERTLDLNRENLNMNEVLDEIISRFALRVAKRDGTIIFNNKAKQPIAHADKFHLTNVLYSLLDNADKYSPNAPHITIETANTHKGLRITVADEGIGIGKDAQKFIFDKFYRVPTGDVHDVKGFGLGLSYAKMVVEGHGGSVQVESQPNAGSRFHVYIS